MRHNVDGRKLGRTASHRRALYRNLVISLITHGRIKTTTPKAKEARRLAERLITFAKRGDLSARRHVASILNDKRAVQKLFDEIGPRYATRPGGYTRVMKMSKPRRGDAAEMALLELVEEETGTAKKKATKKKASTKKKAAAKKPAAKKKATAKKATAKKAEAKAAATEEKAEGAEAPEADDAKKD